MKRKQVVPNIEISKIEMKVKSKVTGKVYTGGVIGYSIRDSKGIVWIDNRVLVTYSDVGDLDTLKRLFQEDYKVTSIPKKPEEIDWKKIGDKNEDN